MELFRLFGSVLIDNKDAIEKLKNTDKKAASTADKFKSMAAGAAKVGGAIIGIGAAAATGMTKLVMNSAEAGDRVDKMSQKIGLSRQAFQEWDYVMGQSGMSIDSMKMGMKSLTNAMTTESKKSEKAFKTLGLSLEDVSKMSREDAFEATITALQRLDDETKKAAIANTLFSKSGSEMMPMLNDSTKNIAELKKQAHEMGMILSNEAVDSAVVLGDSLDAIKKGVGGTLSRLGAALMPTLQKFLDVIIKSFPTIQKMFEQFAPIMATAFEKLLPPIMDLAEALLPMLLDLFEQIFPVLGELMNGIMPIITDLIKMLLPPIIEIVKMILPLLLDVLRPILPLLRPLLQILQPFIDLLMLILEPLAELLNMILPPLAELLGKFFEWYLPKISGAFSELGAAIGKTLNGAFSAIKPVVKSIMDVFKGLIDFIQKVFKGDWKGAWDGIVKVFKGIWDGISEIFKKPINWIIDGINAFTGGLSKIKIPDWVPLVGGKGFSIPKIPHLEVGLDYVPYDNFPAILHKGERVMTAEENRAGAGRGDTYIFNFTIDAKNVREFNDLIEIANAAKLRQRMAYGMGGG